MQNRDSLAYSVALTLWLLLALPGFVHAQAGWKTAVAGKTVTMTPPDLAAGEFCRITVYPRTPLAGTALGGFLTAFANRTAAALGRAAPHPAPDQGGTDTVATTSRSFVTPRGQARIAMFVAESLDGQNVRVVGLVASVTDDMGVFARYQPQMQAVIGEMIHQDKAALPPTDPPANTGKAEETAKKEPRYPYTVPPGKGVPNSKIAAVVYQGGTLMNGFIYGTNAYLLLADGTVHEGLDVPPDELDVARSRQGEPKKWGRWRKDGKEYALAWPGKPGVFEVPSMSWTVFPAKPGERINTRYQGAVSGGSVFTGGYYSIWGVKFTPDGRFTKDLRGGSSAGGLGSDVSVSTTYDNDGSTASFSTPDAVGLAHSKPKGRANAGTYSVSGYTLTLHYDDGRAVRLPFFFGGKERDCIFFEGSLIFEPKD